MSRASDIAEAITNSSLASLLQDLVVAASGCSTCDSSTPLYDPSASSTASSTGTPFSITYGTGAASGSLVSDTISIGGFSVASQVFAACDTFDNLLSGDESGLLGMGWQSLGERAALKPSQNLTLIPDSSQHHLAPCLSSKLSTRPEISIAPSSAWVSTAKKAERESLASTFLLEVALTSCPSFLTFSSLFLSASLPPL